MTKPEVHKLEKTRHVLPLFDAGGLKLAQKLEFKPLLVYLPEKIAHQAVRLTNVFWFF